MSSTYGKVDECEHVMLEARRKTRKRIAIIAVSLIVLAIIVVGAVLGTMAHKKSSETVEIKNNGDSISASIKAVCDVTLHKDKCMETFRSAPNASSLNPEELFKFAVKITIAEVSKALNAFSSSNDEKSNITMDACAELLDLTIDNLNNTLTSSSNGDVTVPELVDDLRTWLSSAETYQETCVETLSPDMKPFGESHLKNSTEMTSNALAIITWLGKIADSFTLRRRLLTTADVEVGFHVGRRLLQSTDLKKVAHIVVAKDGSGKYRTISRALKDVPEKSEKRTIIYVKKGVYFENVRVEKKMWNVVVVGDGESKSIVSGRLNVIDGTPTFKTATFAVFGKGFMARDMGFINTAGPSKHQAVALMVSADLAALYRCTMNAYQDTLYVHAQRQFYRDCTIIGTVDFIFGNSAAVLQNCRILPRRPMKGQQITITAQGLLLLFPCKIV
ncbi:PREDICTED: putative pectinesterase/pectinesterase inhibitor 24 [Camelina sativa]|uniref:Pectinesterase n=1 Tax=Camelina sativa TaxID=90675 RepID=A0ABM0T015_CAMSA|nr:PREDICTED: putative pectinesterase/pectinesterase inhibitor 24 [Camelina sativa]